MLRSGLPTWRVEVTLRPPPRDPLKRDSHTLVRLCFSGKNAGSKENHCDIFATIKTVTPNPKPAKKAIKPAVSAWRARSNSKAIVLILCAISERRTRHRVGTVCDQRVTAVTHSKAEKYRRLAQQCRAMASTLSSAQARVSALQMAQVWQRLADEQDRHPGLADRPPPPPGAGQIQPVVQQQQQVQPKDDDKKE